MNCHLLELIGTPQTLCVLSGAPSPRFSIQRLRSCSQDRGLCVCLKQSITISVADPYLADTRHPAPAARCNHHDAAAVKAASPVTVAMVVITHSTTTLAATTGGSCGRNERGGANGGDGSDGKNCLADH